MKKTNFLTVVFFLILPFFCFAQSYNCNKVVNNLNKSDVSFNKYEIVFDFVDGVFFERTAYHGMVTITNKETLYSDALYLIFFKKDKDGYVRYDCISPTSSNDFVIEFYRNEDGAKVMSLVEKNYLGNEIISKLYYLAD